MVYPLWLVSLQLLVHLELLGPETKLVLAVIIVLILIGNYNAIHLSEQYNFIYRLCNFVIMHLAVVLIVSIED